VERCLQRTEDETAAAGFNEQCFSCWTKDAWLWIPMLTPQNWQRKHDPGGSLREHKNSCLLRSSSVMNCRLQERQKYECMLEGFRNEQSHWCSSSFSSSEKQLVHRLQRNIISPTTSMQPEEWNLQLKNCLENNKCCQAMSRQPVRLKRLMMTSGYEVKKRSKTLLPLKTKTRK
jgi:hypothetical protein